MAHDGHPVADLAYDREIVRDEDQRESQFPLELGQQRGHLGLGRHVEGGDRLVADDQPRFGGQRPCDADALALSAAELVRVAVVLLRVEPDALQQFPDARPDRALVTLPARP